MYIHTDTERETDVHIYRQRQRETYIYTDIETEKDRRTYIQRERERGVVQQQHVGGWVTRHVVALSWLSISRPQTAWSLASRVI